MPRPRHDRMVFRYTGHWLVVQNFCTLPYTICRQAVQEMPWPPFQDRTTVYWALRRGYLVVGRVEDRSTATVADSKTATKLSFYTYLLHKIAGKLSFFISTSCWPILKFGEQPNFLLDSTCWKVRNLYYSSYHHPMLVYMITVQVSRTLQKIVNPRKPAQKWTENGQHKRHRNKSVQWQKSWQLRCINVTVMKSHCGQFGRNLGLVTVK